MRQKYKGLVVCFGILAALGCFFVFNHPVTEAAAGINQQINFQGKLANTDGTNVTDGNYSIVFSIYSVASAGTALWTETQGTVAVSSGNFQVQLGSVNTALASLVDFNSTPLYLGVKVGSDAEMTPRVQFTAAPYAFNAEKVGGIAASGLVQLSPGSQQSGNINVSGNATIGGTYNGNTLSSSALTFSAASVASIQAASGQGLGVDSGSSGALSLGTTNATSITLGKNGTVVNAPGGVNINSSTNVPTADQLTIDNTSSTGVTTAGVNGANVKYKGGAAAVEGSGIRVDYTPGTTSGGTWSGLRVVQTAGAAAGVASYGLKLEGAGSGSGADTGVYVNSGWDIGVDIQSGGIQIAATTDLSTPTGSNLKIYAKTVAGRVVPKWVGPAGVDTPFQASFGANRIAMMTPQNGTTATTIMSEWGGGFTNVAATGSFSTPALATTNLVNSVRRARITTNTTAGSIGYHLPAAGMAWRGNAAGLGGFFFTTRFAFSATGAANRGFIGLVDNAPTAPTNVDPTTTTTPGKLGIAFNANTVINWINNTSGTAPTKVVLTGNAPTAANLYELIIYSPPNGSAIFYRVTNLTTNTVLVDSSVNTNIPANTSFLAPEHWVSNQGTGTAAYVESAGWYLESDN